MAGNVVFKVDTTLSGTAAVVGAYAFRPYAVFGNPAAFAVLSTGDAWVRTWWLLPPCIEISIPNVRLAVTALYCPSQLRHFLAYPLRVSTFACWRSAVCALGRCLCTFTPVPSPDFQLKPVIPAQTSGAACLLQMGNAFGLTETGSLTKI